jgi:uncharacterized membrane-anchored protein
LLALLALLLMIMLAGVLGLLAENASLFALIDVIVVGCLAGGLRVRVRLRADNRQS